MAHQVTQQTHASNDALLNAGIFSKADVAALSTNLNEPAWLTDKRQVAWSVFEETPMPSTSDEDWRRTSLKRVKWNNMKLADAPGFASASSLADLPADVRDAIEEGREASGRIVIANGKVLYHELAPEMAEQGVIFTDLSTAIREHPELVEKYLGTEAVPPSNSKFAALNSALWQAGAFLYLPKGVAVDQHLPFQTALILDGEGSVMLPRTLIVAEESAEATYIEESISHGAHGIAMNVGVVEIYAAQDAYLRYVDVQNWGEDVYNFNVKRSVGLADSNVIWETGQLGSRLTKTYFDSLLPGNGANMEFNGVYFLEDKQHLDLDCLIHHIGVATGGDLLLHGALKDKSRNVFTGLIKIDPTGQQTNSYLKNENMMLDKTARADSIPSLEIDANDVRASHGATISQIDEEYLFYLQSRGIPRSTAVRMVVEGFFYKVFDRMYNERVREKLFNAVTAKIGD
jgi:Fe-S cluster assembly protein SufD